MSDTPTLTAQDLGWHGLTPGQSEARRIGIVASTLLLTLLPDAADADADADPQWSCFLYSFAKEAANFLLRICDGV